ncbi:CRISPR-associated endonuclease Cas2 [Candidatus Roizmanbacteria bacterium CG22_combo_CG10-13_8_21_14_all_38_20]|uniref:CRISPR-associated endonuclease Cas2 n=1 Tax=Candidatus Roizmanbacteria bacterium CG22_combo_CG10-13_8_21_14_all_38_20 TaxID=1974862 RepID=A0A2H0BVN1_9BACT|nr:CRISPR-associated endonuclease Cas2 [Candidatus Microgenomates bacterium]PIP61599.1 MAG: CRISPR-associated endonuclease Cas2 [Candidatus Roizmanbacteria bacterium CG22_combo_CG10-13_8_21_14_all_38_20]PJC30578.1 MAG: CRISPR-associated endonuclease Cas2 [Candidatus Roizmanbacteria bacterium CG_4_9_14_0_2_um_filter_38_17]
MPTNSKQKDKIRELTFGTTDGVSNVLLYFLYINKLVHSRNVMHIPGMCDFNQADYLLTKFAKTQIRRALYSLIQQGLVDNSADRTITITKLGKTKARTKLQLEVEPKPWKGKLYLINYDIPTKANSKRVMFQRLLLKHNAAMLQNSVYITPYNPSPIIQKFSKKYSLPGEILISILDIKSTFQTAVEVRSILWKVFKLEELNQRYAQFLDSYAGLSSESIQNKKLTLSITFQYASIRKDDPALPSQLLLERYLGFEATKLFHKLITHL